jgi:Ni/Fe-hydrogenase subunit HybB-like protein
MSEISTNKAKMSLGSLVLYLLLAIGVVLTVIRFNYGLGAVTNLNDTYPWGLWIGFDILTGIALAAGGFTLTAAIYIWGNKKYYPLARPAILTAFLGYVFFVIALVIDLGRGPVMWHMFLPWLWQHNSVMFEVGWCVGTYLTILILEFLPSVLEKYKMTEGLKLWRTFTPYIVVLLLTLFTYAMTSSIGWAIGIFLLALVCNFLEPRQAAGSVKNVPTILIMAGVALSCMHQSSLGSLYLIVPDKLNHLWHTPILSFMFLASAIMVGPAMVIFEGVLSAKIFKRKPETELLAGLGKAMPILLIFYLLMRVSDLLVRGVLDTAFNLNLVSISFWLELAIGAVIPLILFSSPAIASTEKGLFWGSLCMVLGLFIHRLNVSVIGMQPAGWESYRPAIAEYFISLGVVAAGLLVFRYIVRNFPIYEESPSPKAS